MPYLPNRGEKNESGWRIQKKDALHSDFLNDCEGFGVVESNQNLEREIAKERVIRLIIWMYASVSMHVCVYECVCVSVCYHYKHSIY